MIQEILNNHFLGYAVIPPGEYTVPEHTKFNIPFNLYTLYGYGAYIKIVDANGDLSKAVPTQSLFDCGNRPNSRLDIKGLTINGPDTTGWDQNIDNPMGAINWVYYKTWDSCLTIQDVKITGGYGYGVQRSGGGKFYLIDCELSGWVGGFSFFESHGGYGESIAYNVKLHAPVNSKYSSIGAYIHPHLDVFWDNVDAKDWNRYACYLNGNPQSAGTHKLSSVTATNCSLIQTGSSSETILANCVEQGTVKNGGSYFKGPVTSTGSRWASTGMIGFLSGTNVDRRFIRDTFAKSTGICMAAASNTQGRILFNNCHAELANKAAILKLVNLSTVSAKVVSCTYSGTSSAFVFNIEGGSVQFIDSPVFPNTRVVAPGILL